VKISDEKEIAVFIDHVLKENPHQVDKYRKGKGQLLEFFVGQVMKKTRGKANSKMANETLKEALTKS